MLTLSVSQVLREESWAVENFETSKKQKERKSAVSKNGCVGDKPSGVFLTT